MTSVPSTAPPCPCWPGPIPPVQYRGVGSDCHTGACLVSPFTEVRLSGSQATLPGVMRHINRRLAGGPFSRVEVVFSTQAAGRVEPSLARNQIKQLLREHGMRNVAVSARAHAALLDDASGEHLIRLYPDMSQARDAGTHDIAQPASSPKQQAAGRASWLPSRALRWLPEGLRRRLRSQDSPAPQPAVSAAQAAAVLRQAVATAARDQAARAQHGPWAHVDAHRVEPASRESGAVTRGRSGQSPVALCGNAIRYLRHAGRRCPLVLAAPQPADQRGARHGDSST